MNIKLEVVEQEITDLALQVYGNRLGVYVTNKNTAHEVIFLIAALLGQNSKQMLNMLDTGRAACITCDGIDIGKIETVIIKVEPEFDFVSRYGAEEIVDAPTSEFFFEPTLFEHSDFKLGETK